MTPNFGKHGCPFSGGQGQDPVTPQSYLDFVGGYLDQAKVINLPILTGEDLQSTVLAKKSISGGLDGWGWNELKALPLSWYVGLAWILRLVEDTGL